VKLSDRSRHDLATREDTRLLGEEFPFNIFTNRSADSVILYVHWHENIEIIRMRQGEAVFNIGSSSLPAAAGDILFVNSGMIHTGYSVNDSAVVYDAIVFNPGLLKRRVYDPHSEKLIFPYLEGLSLLPCRVERESVHYEKILAIITAMTEEFERREPGFEVCIKAWLNLLFAAVYRYGGAGLGDIGRHERRTMELERFRKLFDHLEEHFAQRIPVAEAAAIVSMSPHHFCRTFKNITGKTFVEFLNLYRINEAESLLRYTSLPVTEVSLRVGFCNTNYFDRVFKQIKGYPPSGCRKKDASL